jgi:hypothetical protein
LGTTPAQDADLAEKVETLTDEVARLREQIAVPETDAELTSLYGMGPAASKVYAVRQGISLGGYGEFYYAAPLADDAINNGDFYRFISYVGYKFSDRLVMNTEIEFEHATTSGNFAGKAGAISVEFSYLDFLLHEQFNLRAGNLLLPIGIINEMHEPAFYRGNIRPDLERSIVPTTWRELGAAAHGQFGERLRYNAFLVNGLNAGKFDAKGIREGRQKGNQVLFEDVGGGAAVAFAPDEQLSLGASAYLGGADHSMLGDDVEVSNSIVEAHAEFRRRGLFARAMIARAHIEGAGELTEAIFPTGGGNETKVVPEDQLGWYAELGYDVARHLLGPQSQMQISPWIRFEQVNLVDAIPDLPARPLDESLDATYTTVGVDVKPYPLVVLKLDFVHRSDATDADPTQEIRVGAGFVY